MNDNSKFHPIKLFKSESFFVVFLDVGDYVEHDALFEKYGVEPSGYGWEGVVLTLLEEEYSDMLPLLELDPNGDEFWVGTKKEEHQLGFTSILMDLIGNPERIESILKRLPEERKG